MPETTTLWATLAGIGLLGSFLSGLLGVGGAAFIIPMLLYIPPWVGAGQLDIRVATGLSIVLVFAGAASGALAHKRLTGNDPAVVWAMAPTAALGALVGGVLSAHVPAEALRFIFALSALAAGLMMFIPRPPGGDEPNPGATPSFPTALGAAIAGAVGLLSGMVGAGGAFLLVPIMIYLLKVPTRTTVASSLPIVLLSAFSGLVGKLAAGQILWAPALFLVAGALPGAQLGARCSARLRAASLRYTLGGLTALMAIRMWVDLLR
ncbi:MAG: sulfite exporter TauE/SafE family protein [Bacillota bacterium]